MGVLRVEVIDTGAGIAEEDQAKVFGEFAQFNRNELQGGGEKRSKLISCRHYL